MNDYYDNENDILIMFLLELSMIIAEYSGMQGILFTTSVNTVA